MSETETFDERYPYIAGWAQDGWIEIGRDEHSRSFVRVLDIGGLIWEGDEVYDTMDGALSAAEAGIRQWTEENG